MNGEQASSKIADLKAQIKKQFVGKEQVVELCLTCMLAGGHVLLEDVPGIGKTTLAKAVAGAAGLTLGRIQFTPDTLPGDVTGFSVYNQKTCDFEYKKGAVMNEIVLADEINRTPPKTQAALLEVMAEGQVSVDGVTYKMADPFFVIATQNPVEYVGTYPLPEAQLDRFMMRLSMGYPEKETELKIARVELGLEKDENTGAAAPLSAAEITELREMAKEITLSEAVLTYAEDIVTATRGCEKFKLGASTRALLALLAAARAYAFLQGRDFVKPDDVKALAVPVLAHRMVLSAEAKRQKSAPERILQELVTHVRIPV